MKTLSVNRHRGIDGSDNVKIGSLHINLDHNHLLTVDQLNILLLSIKLLKHELCNF